MENLEKIHMRITDSVSFKLAIIAIITLLLLIPAGMIQNLIREREQRCKDTINEVTSKWGNSQTLCGPVLTVPYKTYMQTNDGIVTSIHHAHFLPSSLDISGSVVPEVRYRGIYEVIAYKTSLLYQGSFDPVDLRTLSINPTDVLWKEAIIEIGIPDMRGINQPVIVSWNESRVPIAPGIPVKDINPSGVNAKVNVTENTMNIFSFRLDLNGSHSLNFVPLGKETMVNLSSPWKDPSFMGAFVPDEHHISDTGFTARWNILQLNRNYPQQWTDDHAEINESAFGVNLIVSVDTYQKSMRSVKYAILFIALTFLIFFFAEFIHKTKVHPVHYLLVGIGLIIFYTLLTALSEHIGFALSYFMASMVIITLISLFAQSLYKKIRVSLTVAISLTALYVFLFVVLQLTDYALLIGSAGLLIVLAIIMYFSKKINWYETVTYRNHKKSTEQ
ncbi:MAG: cell envelope integrity protein CreD [Bacteroidales bacterium]|nr:cell envelope integrity protein CreD [Bacteroidales bacterium]